MFFSARPDAQSLGHKTTSNPDDRRRERALCNYIHVVHVSSILYVYVLLANGFFSRRSIPASLVNPRDEPPHAPRVIRILRESLD